MTQMKKFSIPSLKIDLSPSLLQAVRSWISRFNHEELYTFKTISLIDGRLVMHPYDVSNFLKIVSVDQSNPLDIYRLRTAIHRALNAQLKRCQTKSSRDALIFNKGILAETDIGSWAKEIPPLLSTQRTPLTRV